MTESEQSLLRAALALDLTDDGPSRAQSDTLRHLQHLVHVENVGTGVKLEWLAIQRKYKSRLAALRDWRASESRALGLPETFDYSDWHRELEQGV